MYRNRQDAIEAMELAANGKVKCYYQTKPLSALESVEREEREGSAESGETLADSDWACPCP